MPPIPVIPLGPCGPIRAAEPTVYRPGELFVRLDERVVTRDGFTPEGLAILQMLFANGAARVESLRTAPAFAKSISTGQASEIWRQGVTVANPPASWIRDFGDARWIAASASDGDEFPASAKPGQTAFTLNIGQLLGARGYFALHWAADDNAEWSIGPGGSLSGQTTGVAQSFLQSAGAPRELSGTFESNSVLQAVVTNSALPGRPAAPNPTGLIVSGSAGADPVRAVTDGSTLPPFSDPPRLSLARPAAPAAQPGVFLTPPMPGGRELKPPFHPELRDELCHLVAYFSGEPSDALIRCLRFALGVRFAERIPAVELKLAPTQDPTSIAVPGAQPTDPDKPLRVMKDAWLSSIKWTEPAATSILAILDGEYVAPTGKSHGQLVAAAAFACMRPGDSLSYLVVTEPNRDTMDKIRNPSRYFSALRDVRKNLTIRVVNLSRGSIAYTVLEQQEMDLMEEAGIVVVAAAGQYNAGLKVDFPAALDTVVSVGGANTNDSAKWGAWTASNFDFDVVKWQLRKNYTAIDVVGPAKSLYLLNLEVSGTSFSAPMVAALCAAMRAANSSLGPGEVRKILRETARDPDGLPNPKKPYGSGMVDWGEAVAAAARMK